jgi:hypothetical protein
MTNKLSFTNAEVAMLTHMRERMAKLEQRCKERVLASNSIVSAERMNIYRNYKELANKLIRER